MNNYKGTIGNNIIIITKCKHMMKYQSDITDFPLIGAMLTYLKVVVTRLT